MLYNHLKIAWRNIARNRMLSLINVGGLSVGIATCFLILQYVQFEKSYDQFHAQKEQIFRLHWNFYEDGQQTLALPKAAAGAGPGVLDAFPEVLAQTRLLKVAGTVNVSHEDRAFNESKVLFASSDFFNIFSYRLVYGNKEEVLDGPNKVVISQSAAARYFPGIEDPVGRILHVKEGETVNWSLLVTGVMEDLPPNSHLEAEVIGSYETFTAFASAAESSMYWVNFYTYLLTTPGTTKEQLDSKLATWMSGLEEFNEWREADRPKAYVIPLTDIHLHSGLMQEIKTNGDAKVVAILLAAAFFILVIAWLNYINLTTAKGLERGKEVGIKKVVGASRSQLLIQFLLEALIINFISLLIAFTLYQFCQPLLASVLPAAPHWAILFQGNLFLYTAAIVVLGAFLSGFYPAMAISAYKPAVVLKGRISHSATGHGLRKGIVCLQFGLSLLLLVSTYTVREQVYFMLSQDLGFESDQVLVVLAPDAYSPGQEEKNRLFREEVLSSTGVVQASQSLVIPGEEVFFNDASRTDANDQVPKLYGQGSIDPWFIPLMGMEMKAGRNFDPALVTDMNSLILNESALAMLQFASPEEAVGKKLFWMGDDGAPWTIIGVVADHHQHGLSRQVEPMIYYQENAAMAYFTFKLSHAGFQETIARLEQTYTDFFPGNPFDYYFLDEHFNRQYQGDQRVFSAFSGFSIVAIVIACLGLFGLASFEALQRTKEMGIRKVLGASLYNLAMLFTGKFFKLLLVSSVAALPVCYWLADSWLDSYTYRMNLDWGIFIAPVVLLFAIALLTLVSHTIKTVRLNPVEALRNE